MQPVLWAGLAASAVTALIPAHGDSSMPEGTNDFVFWALPVAKFVFNVSGAAVTGALLLACLALRPGSREHARALNFAGVSAVVWMLAAVVAGFMDYLDNWGEPVAFTESFARQLGYFFTHVGLGQLWLTTLAIISLIPLLCLGARSLVATTLAALLALAGWVPLALMGHPNYGEGHEAGILAFALHIIAAAAWLGGLIALVVLRPVLDVERLRVVAGRYSTLALFAFGLLVFSGYLRAQATVGVAENLLTPFGVLVLIKIIAATAVGLAGYLQRRWILTRMGRSASGSVRWFWTLVGLDLVLMGAASASAVTLLRRDEPVPDNPVVNYRLLAEKMADEPLPPAPLISTFFTETAFDPLWSAVVMAGVLCYGAGVRRIHRQGRSWPMARTVSWVTGMVALFYVTNGGVNEYQNFLLSAQILVQMALMTIIGLLLALGHPAALVLRAVHARNDGSRGLREWVQLAGASRVGDTLVRPSVATTVLVTSALAVYFSPWLEWSARELLGHQWTVIYFLAVGWLFATSMLRCTEDPVQPLRRAWAALSVVTLCYLLLGVVLIHGMQLLSPQWYAAMESPWGITPTVDQRIGGWYLIAVGGIHATVLAGVLARRSHRATTNDSSPVLAAGSQGRAPRAHTGRQPIA